jgi:hypothetical protein
MMINGDNATLLRTANGGEYLGDLAVTPDGGRLFVASAIPYVIVLSTESMGSVGKLNIGDPANSVSLSRGGSFALASLGGVCGGYPCGTVLSFNTTSYGLVTQSDTSQFSIQVRSTEDGRKGYVMTGGHYQANAEGDTRYVEVLETVPPMWPTGSSLSGSVGVSSVTLTWPSAADDIGVSSYKIYENSTLIASLGGTTYHYQVGSLSPNTTYVFQVQAEGFSGLSTTNGLSTMVETLHDTTPPVWPHDSYLKASDVGPIFVFLEWGPAIDDVGVANYRVYNGNNLLAVLDASIWPGNIREYMAIDLTPGKTYEFRVEAGDPFKNWSTDGPSLTVTTPQTSSTSQSSTFSGLIHDITNSILHLANEPVTLRVLPAFLAYGSMILLVLPLYSIAATLTAALAANREHKKQKTLIRNPM